MQIAQESQRKSMFQAPVFDMNTFGVIATLKLGSDTYVRAIAAKAYSLRDAFYAYQCNRENIDNATIMGLYSDTKFEYLGNNLLSYGFNIMHDLKAHPYLGPDVSGSNTEILGDMMTFGLGIDSKAVMQSNLTFFAHTAFSMPNGNGNSDDYQIKDALDPQSDEFSIADYAKGEMLSNRGYSLYLGMKYDIESMLSIGAEYNHGSKYWFSGTQGAEDMYNKLATRGEASELYITWKFHKKMYAKVGYLDIKENFTGSGWHFGTPAKKDGTQKISYLTLDAKF